MSGVTKMAWDVMSGVTKTAWDVLSGVANLCGMFCPGCIKMAWDVLSRDVLSGSQYDLIAQPGIYEVGLPTLIKNKCNLKHMYLFARFYAKYKNRPLPNRLLTPFQWCFTGGFICYLVNQPATVIYSYIVFCMTCFCCHSLSLPHSAIWVELYIV